MEIACYNYFITKYRELMVSGVVKNGWNSNFADFRDLALILAEAGTGGVLY